jgi:beta-lactamase regulating signal transducer with metallopeptidase domain
MTDWLLHTLVATSGLILLVLIVREPVRRRFGSRVTYGLWLIPLARLFMPTLTHTVERSVPAATSVPFPVVAREPLWMAHVAAPAPTLFERAGGWPALLIALWLGVAGGLFLSRMIAFHRDRRAILHSSASMPRLGPVRLVRSSEISSPVALGILKPIIAVPLDFNRRYDQRERRLVLEHELAHHRSGDLVANLLAFVLLCLQWFNPLAWAAHAAFRFDQEAACDARVLDRAPAADRASYGRAIAIAASGRALLFASALDRPTSLQRRLQSMLRSPSPSRRVAGRLLIAAAAAVALPLTAGHAIAYVDVPVPAPAVAPVAAAPVPPAAVVATAAAVQAVAAPELVPAARPVPRPVSHAVYAESDGDGDMTINEQYVTIDGVRKRWEDLTPAEFARVRAAVAKARTQLANTHIDQARLERDLANVPDKVRIAEMQRHLAETRARIAENIGRIDAEAAEARASGREPDRLEAAVRERLAEAENTDFETAARSLANIDRKKIADQVAGAQQSVERAKAELERIQARIDADPRH